MSSFFLFKFSIISGGCFWFKSKIIFLSLNLSFTSFILLFNLFNLFNKIKSILFLLLFLIIEFWFIILSWEFEVVGFILLFSSLLFLLLFSILLSSFNFTLSDKFSFTSSKLYFISSFSKFFFIVLNLLIELYCNLPKIIFLFFISEISELYVLILCSLILFNFFIFNFLIVGFEFCMNFVNLSWFIFFNFGFEIFLDDCPAKNFIRRK